MVMVRTNIYLLVFILYSSSTLHINGQTTFSFTESNSAGGNSYTCTDSTSCRFSCVGYRACSRATMNCADGAHCAFDCNGESACRGSTMRCPDSSRCDLSFIGYQSGIDSNIYCGTDGECFIDANGEESLYGSDRTRYTAIDARYSSMIMITAMGKTALGAELKCPRNQPTEPRCIIQMIADDNTVYSNSEIFYWNWVYVEQATDIEFRCEGTPYDAFFNQLGDKNILYQYGNSDQCYVSFSYNENDFYDNYWTTACPAFSSNYPCTAIPTSAPTVTTDMPTTLPTVTPTTPPTKTPTALTAPPTASSASPTKTPTTSPTEMPAIPHTPAPTEMPTVSPITAPTGMPTAPLTTVPSANPTKRPTEHSISAMKPTGAPSPSVDVTLAEGEAVEGTDASEDDLNDIRTSNKAQTSDALVAVALSFGFIAIGIAACIWYKSLQMKKQHEDDVKYIDGTSSIENTTIGGGEYKDTTGECKNTAGECKDVPEVPGSPRFHQTNESAVPTVFKEEEKEETEEEKESDDVKVWLEQIGLPMYYDCFVQNGLTSLQFIGCINDKNDLHNIGIMLVGHQMVLMGEIMKLKQSNTETLVAEEGNGTFITEGGEDEENADDEGAGGITAGNICKPDEFEQNLSNAAFISDIVMDDVINDIEAGGNAEAGVTAGGGMTAGMEYNTADGSDQDVDDIVM